NMHGWHVSFGIVYRTSRVHIGLVAEARSDLLLPSDPASQRRTKDHLLLPCSEVHGRAAFSSSLAPLPHFRRLSRFWAPSSDGASFFLQNREQAWNLSPTCRVAYLLDSLTLCL